ncbi:MAG TPA: low molecular weight protein arginine phosphatase [Clostridia bacterium]|nr:low molecular weight protein arginine phosphatase [Clostridia bacterium]
MAEGRDGTKSIGGTKGGGSPLDGGWPLGSIEVFSAGVAAFPDMPASPEAVEVMFEMGIDLEGHRASVLIPEDVESADLVLTMTERHRDFVRQMAPGAAGKVYTLGEFAGRGEDVPDPFGRSLDTYRQSAEAIKDLVIQALVRLKEG